MTRSLSLIFVTFLLGSGALAADTKRHFSAEYRLYVSGLLIGKADVHFSASATEYVLSAHMRPAGFGQIGRAHVRTPVTS